MSFLSMIFGKKEPLGKVEVYQTKSKKWRWKVANSEGRVVANPIKSYASRSQALRSFREAKDVIGSVDA